MMENLERSERVLILKYDNGKPCAPNRQSLYSSKVAHQAGAKSGFHVARRDQEHFSLPLDRMVVHRKVTLTLNLS